MPELVFRMQPYRVCNRCRTNCSHRRIPRELPWHQRDAAIRGGDRCEEILGRVHAMELRGLEDGVQRGSDFGAAARLRAVVILSSNNWAADPTLGGVMPRPGSCRVGARLPCGHAQLAADRGGIILDT